MTMLTQANVSGLETTLPRVTNQAFQAFQAFTVQCLM